MEFIGKGDRELIEAVNTALGMKHRSKPYDLKNIDDLIEATKMITGELLDTWHCYSLINTACEIYDEALEHYHTARGWSLPPIVTASMLMRMKELRNWTARWA